MEFWVSIAACCALAAITAVCLYALVVLRSVRLVLDEVHGQLRTLGQMLTTLPYELKELRQHVLGMLVHAEEAAKHGQEAAKYGALITEKIHRDMSQSGGIFAEVEALRVQLRRLRLFVEANITEPLQRIASLIAAVSSAATAFLQTLQGKK
jgi:hypothetical protein